RSENPARGRVPALLLRPALLPQLRAVRPRGESPVPRAAGGVGAGQGTGQFLRVLRLRRSQPRPRCAPGRLVGARPVQPPVQELEGAPEANQARVGSTSRRTCVTSASTESNFSSERSRAMKRISIGRPYRSIGWSSRWVSTANEAPANVGRDPMLVTDGWRAPSTTASVTYTPSCGI